jgi:hypothetical protein
MLMFIEHFLQDKCMFWAMLVGMGWKFVSFAFIDGL